MSSPSHSVDSDTHSLETRMEQVEQAYRYAKDDLDQWYKNTSAVFLDTLTDEDKEMLDNGNRSTFRFPIFAPIINQFGKNIRESMPSVQVLTREENKNLEDEQTALNVRLNRVFDSNDMEAVTGAVGVDAAVGGFGLYKMTTDYDNNIDFQQGVRITYEDDPATVVFDPASNAIDKSDAMYAFKFTYIEKKVLKKLYPELNLDERPDRKSTHNGFKWTTVEKKSQNVRVAVIDFYFKEVETKTIYQVNTDQGEDITFDKPSNQDAIIAARDITNTTVKHCRFTENGFVKIDGESLATCNINILPWIPVYANIIRTKTRNQVVAPVRPAIDAQRVRNISLNYLLFEMLNNQTGTWLTPVEGLTKTVTDALKNPTLKQFIPYQSHIPNDNGEIIPLEKPQYVPTPPISTDNLAIFDKMAESVQQALGNPYPQADQIKNLAGAGEALDKMADFLSANQMPILKSIEKAMVLIGKGILNALPELYQSENIKIKKQVQGKQSSISIPVNYDSDLNEVYSVQVLRGASYRTQESTTIKHLMLMAQNDPTFAKWLSSVGSKFLLENLQFNNKAEIIASYEQFLEANQTNQSPSPAEQLEQLKIQLEMARAQNEQLKTQNEMEKTELERVRLILQAYEAEAQVHDQNTKNTLKLTELVQVQ